MARLLSRLAVSEAQLRRVFFEKQLKDTKENLVKAEHDLQLVQEKSGVIVLDKQAEALITGAAQVRAQISEREVQLKVMRTGATEQNPDVIRLNSELRALRGELARMESAQGGAAGSAVDMPVGRIPAAAIDYVRARRELKLQEALLESMVRQYEIAKLDEAKEGPQLQQVDAAVPPDKKSKPSRALIVLAGTFAGFLLATIWVISRRWLITARAADPDSTLIFALATVSAVYAWRNADSPAQREWVIGLFALNGCLNVLWSTLFFAVKRPDWALIEVVFLWLSILLPIVVFWRFARPASLYLLPYLAWVSFAAFLNLTVVRLNAPFT